MSAPRRGGIAAAGGGGAGRRAVTLFVYLWAPFAKRAPTDTP